MRRRGFAVVLILSWVFLSAIDVLEDLQPHSPGESLVAGNTRQPNSLANNIVESADHSRVRPSKLLQKCALDLSICSPTISQKNLRIHKRHRVLLI
jgi:hypothetical protein